MTKRVRLSEVAEFINGRAFKPEEWETEGLPIIRIQNLTGSTDTINYYSGDVEPKYLVRDDDILISWSASLGVYWWRGGDAILNQHIFKVELKEKLIDKEYFYYAAQNALVEMESHVHGATMQHITRDPFLAIEIPLPPLTEQKRIASLLARADRLRQLRRTAHDLSGSVLQSVFLEMFGDIATNSKKWDICIIDDVVDGTSEKSNSEKRGYPVLGMSNITYEGRLDLEKLSYVELSDKEFAQLKLERGDVIFNRTNSTELVGKTTYWNYDFDAVIASYLVKLKLKKEMLPEFFVAMLNMPHYKNMFQERCKKAVGQSNISPTLLKEFPIFVPPLSLQEEFAGVVARVESLRGRMGESERQVEGLFESLLAESFG